MKRLFDIIFSFLLLPAFLIFYIFVGLAIKIEDGGPILYFSDRIGKGGIIFKMLKFRSMKVNAPDIRLSDGSTFNSDDDKRVTKVGRIIRKTSIDEIPQVINIFKGDMSFIGPRPDSAMWLQNYLNEERIILSVRPGITGYNQVVNRNSVGTKEKMKFDILYVNNISFIFDLRILFMTFRRVTSFKDVYRV